jgi:hypothetical protein
MWSLPTFSERQLFAVVVATSFAAGLNTYATIATLGLLARAGMLELPPSLQLLGDWPVIGAALALFAVEFVVDKIPAVDLVWNVLHTFVRVPAAALLAYRATMQLSLEEQLLATGLGAAVALVAHSGKTAARTAVTPSPEPFSNIALSLGEDAVAVLITWLAVNHPVLAAAIALAFLALMVVVIRAVTRSVRAAFRGAVRQVRRLVAR